MKQPFFIIGGMLFFFTIFMATVFPYLHHIDVNTVYAPLQEPGTDHWLGTNHAGFDMLSLLVKGLQSSLYVGFTAGIMATIIGTFLGIYAGFSGGWRDDAINMVTNLIIVIPQFVLLVLISTSLHAGQRSLSLIAVIIAVTSWTWSARAVRAQASSIRGSSHITLAKVNGCTTFAIVFWHILPYLYSYVFMVFTIQMSSAIISESCISMIGLGPYDTVSLGTILNDAIRYGTLRDGAWWAFIPATFLISVIVFSFYIINTSMEGVFNPRLRK